MKYEASPPQRRFSPDDPLLSKIQRDIAAEPNRKQRVAELFATPLSAKRTEIVAVRSGDVVTTLRDLTVGHIPTTPPEGKTIKFKEPGWFYMTPIYSHPFYDRNPALKGETTSGSFNTEVSKNIDIYASPIAFATAFTRNVMPFLPDTWSGTAKVCVEKVEGENSVVSDDRLIEAYCDLLREEIRMLRSANMPPETVLNPRLSRRRLTMIHHLTESLPDDIDPGEVISFLVDVENSHKGVVIGFNENIFQGDVVTDAFKPGNVIHSAPELAIKPPTGKIDLSNVIVAIETLGDYEDRINTTF